MIWRRITSGTVKHAFDHDVDIGAICGRDMRYGMGTWYVVTDDDDAKPCGTCLYQLQLREKQHD